jgi:hypothetical protein
MLYPFPIPRCDVDSLTFRRGVQLTSSGAEICAWQESNLAANRHLFSTEVARG